MTKATSTRQGRIDLSQVTITLPDGRKAGFWALAPVRPTHEPSPWATEGPTAKVFRNAAKAIPADVRESVWAIAEDGERVWAVVNVRTGVAAAAHSAWNSWSQRFYVHPLAA